MRYRVITDDFSFSIFAKNKKDALSAVVASLKSRNYDGSFRLERFFKKSLSWEPLLDRYGSDSFDIFDFYADE